MKKIIITVALCLIASPAYADVYVKVDANGVAIDGPIMCNDCGGDTLFTRLTLKEGERYVLQGTGSAGIGGNNPDTQVKVDIPTQTWTVTNTQTQEVVQEFTPQTSPGNNRNVYVEPTITNPVVETQTATTDSSTVVMDTATAIIDTATVFSDIDFNSSDWLSKFMTWLNNLITQLYARLEGLKK
jgi:hypothetical protein